MSHKEFARRTATAMDLKLHFSPNRYYSEGDEVGKNKDWKYEKEEIGFVYDVLKMCYISHILL
jgi:hypothetical protein